MILFKFPFAFSKLDYFISFSLHFFFVALTDKSLYSCLVVIPVAMVLACGSLQATVPTQLLWRAVNHTFLCYVC